MARLFAYFAPGIVLTVPFVVRFLPTVCTKRGAFDFGLSVMIYHTTQSGAITSSRQKIALFQLPNIYKSIPIQNSSHFPGLWVPNLFVFNSTCEMNIELFQHFGYLPIIDWQWDTFNCHTQNAFMRVVYSCGKWVDVKCLNGQIPQFKSLGQQFVPTINRPHVQPPQVSVLLHTFKVVNAFWNSYWYFKIPHNIFLVWLNIIVS